MPKEIISDVKPSVAHMRKFECKVCARFAVKTRTTLEANERSCTLLRCLSFSTYLVTMEDDKRMGQIGIA